MSEPPSERARRPHARGRARAKAAAIGLAATLLALELVPRLAGFRYPVDELPAIVWNPDQDSALDRGDGLHRHEVETLWGPRPGATISFAEPERVNAAGYRGPLLDREPRPGVLRVATLGDSTTFGWGVAWESTYSARLVGELDREGVEAEVLCAGVIGHMLLQGVARWRELVEPLRPHVVVLAFGAVNEHFPQGLHSHEELVARKRADARPIARVAAAVREHSRAAHLVAWLVEVPTGRREAHRQALYDRLRRGVEAVGRVGRRDWPGERRLSVEAFERALGALVGEVRASGAEPVLVSPARRIAKETEAPVLVAYGEAIARVAAESDAELCDARALFRAHPLAESELLFADGVHPTAVGHELLARALAPLVLRAADRRSP